ncbi:CDP-glycerol glycerophosphotransferase family protein [Alphaproteobacteria bacterium LSUCC0684]
MNILKFIEKFFGYGPITEKIVAIFSLFGSFSFFRILLTPVNKRIFVSCGLPSYISNINSVLTSLHKEGYRIFIFPEWLKDSNLDAQLREVMSGCFLICNNSSRILPLFESFVFLSSVSGKHYYFPRKTPRYYYFHSVAGLDGFVKGGFDSYHVFLTATIQQYDELIERFQSEKKFGKRVLKVGYPKLDDLRKRVADVSTVYSHDKPKVLYAPTYSNDTIYKNLSSLPKSVEIIESLLSSGFSVVFRPHPLSIRHGLNRVLFENIKKRFSTFDFVFDTSVDYFNSYLDSCIMVTDVSGTAITYRYAFDKPVIFYCEDHSLAQQALSGIEILGPLVAETNKLSIEIISCLELNDRVATTESYVFNLDNSKSIFLNAIMDHRLN